MSEPRHPFQSIISSVSEAEPLVARYRAHGDRWAQHHVPAHITVAGPWPLSQAMPLQALSRVRRSVAETSYVLSSVGVFGNALCLLPSDEAPLLAVRKRILKVVGVEDGVDAAWRPHLTVARDMSNERHEEVMREMASSLPLACELRDLRLAQLLEDGRVTITAL